MLAFVSKQKQGCADYAWMDPSSPLFLSLLAEPHLQRLL